MHNFSSFLSFWPLRKLSGFCLEVNNMKLEDIINKNNGIIALKNDIQDLSNSLKWVRNNYSTYDQESIREETVSKYCGDVLVERLKGVYKELNERTM